jgi:5-methylcytosine-specific restriction endonuclease McrA
VIIWNRKKGRWKSLFFHAKNVKNHQKTAKNGIKMTREETEAFYNSPEWRRKQKAILRRDHYQCQLCKRYGRIREAKIVHHKLELAEYPELAMKDDNLVSVCMKCHNKLHPEKGADTINKRRFGRYDRYSSEKMA